MRVYLDNAATTPLDPEVFEAMKPYLLDFYGNPSSTHAHGREARSALEKARKQIADLLNASPAEIFFTSGGTEADNTAIICGIEAHGIRHAVTSPLEHHAVLHTLKQLEHQGKIQLSLVNVEQHGNLDYAHLQALLHSHPHSFVSLMHGNNEIGNINDISRIGELCREFKSIFHSDTVQTLAHCRWSLNNLSVSSLVGSAHKFHGPKGVGLLYLKKGQKMSPLLHGGAQERNMRGGTENLYGIIGMAKALEIAYHHLDEHQKHFLTLKSTMIEALQEKIPGIRFNGESANLSQSLSTVLNVSLPPSESSDMLLFNLDLHQISASAGSACNSGSHLGSHVLQALPTESNRGSVRFSFSKYNSLEEIQYVVDTLAAIYAPARV